MLGEEIEIKGGLPGGIVRAALSRDLYPVLTTRRVLTHLVPTLQKFGQPNFSSEARGRIRNKDARAG